MDAIEMTIVYLNKLTSQILTISSLLGGFSITVIASILTSEIKNKYINRVFIASVLAASFFIISIFTSADIIMQTTEGYPFPIKDLQFVLSRTANGVSFMGGILCLIVMIGLSGWIKSKSMGIFTSIVSVITFILTFLVIS